MTPPSPPHSRADHLETLFHRYPDLPREVVVKEDILCQGFALAPNLRGEAAAFPKVVLLEGGLYGLRRIIVRRDLNDDSPYLIDRKDGQLVVRDRSSGTALASVRGYPLPPQYATKTFPDGTPYGHVIDVYGEVMVLPQCQFWGPELECRFCDLNETYRRRSQAGAPPQPPQPEHVGQVAAEIFLQEPWPSGEAPLHLNLNGGSVSGTVNGRAEEDLFLQYVAAIRDTIANRRPILLQMQPKTTEVEKRLYAQGLSARLCNLEVWDPRLFAILCPGKERHIGWEEWLRRILDQPYIYGEINVLPGLVVGLELAQPWGFSSVAEAVQSTTQGIQFLISHGVIPRPIHWRIDPLSALAGQRQPPLDYFLQVDRNWYLAWQRYQAYEPVGHLMGPGRNRFPHSAAFDVGRGSGLASSLNRP